MPIDIAKKIETMSIPVNSTIRQAMQAIDRGALGLALLVELETRRFSGLITDGDIRRSLLNGHGLESPVDAIERPKAKTAPIGTPMDEIAAMFSEPIRVIPLLDVKGTIGDLALFDQRMHIPVAGPSLGQRELLYVTDCILSGWVSSAGKYVKKFEEMFADYCGASHGVATSSGTTALHLALLAIGVGPRDEVIVPSLTFIATANAVTYTGARPVFADSEQESWNIDPKSIKEAITSQTKAIIPVHLYGHPAKMEEILDIASHYKLVVIEDAAEAHGALYMGRRVGGIANIGVFSFYGNKIITTGEGGMVVTNHEELARKIEVLRDHGMSKSRPYWHPFVGYNYRMTNIQAALGVAQIERIESILEAKRQMGQLYEDGLKHLPGITLPPKAQWAENVYWMYSILINESEFGLSRDKLIAYLNQYYIETRPFFPPVHKQPIYKTGQELPIAEKLSRTGINLPSSSSIQPIEIYRVCECIRTAQEQMARW